MKENKTFQVKARITERQKQELERYARAYDLNVSEVVRLALQQLLQYKENNGDE